LLCAAVLFASSAAQAFLHLRDVSDLGHLQHITGVWMALAQYGNAGVLYPPLQADGWYAGTRYMPLCVGVIAVLEPLTADYLLAAKLMSLGSMAVLLTGVFIAVRRTTGRTLDAVVFTGLLLALPEATLALLIPHADALAAAFALAGLLVIGPVAEKNQSRSRLSLGISTLFFAASFMTKFSSLAGVAAAAAFWLRRDRNGAGKLLLAWMVLTAAGLALIQHVSDGRFLENLHCLGSGGMNRDSLRLGLARFVVALERTPLAGILIVLALFVVLRRSQSQGLALWDWYFLAAAVITGVILTSPGTNPNHLLELEVAAVLVIAQLLAAPVPGAKPAPSPRLELAARLLVLAVALGGVAQQLRDLHNPQESDYVSGTTVREALPAGARIFAEDATVPVLLGQRPLMLDAFAFRILVEAGRIDDRPLAERISRREFDVLVLMDRVDQVNSRLYPRDHFGEHITNAMRQAYRFDRRVGPYYLFVPEGGKTRNALNIAIANVPDAPPSPSSTHLPPPHFLRDTSPRSADTVPHHPTARSRPIAP
jgi:hypothetical protein